MLTDSDIASMRATQVSALPDVGTILRPTVSPDAAGGASTSWTADSETVACRVHAGLERNARQTLAEKVAVEATHTVTVPVGTDIDETCKLAVSGRTFEVLWVPDREEWHTAVQCAAKETR